MCRTTTCGSVPSSTHWSTCTAWHLSGVSVFCEPCFSGFCELCFSVGVHIALLLMLMIVMIKLKDVAASATMAASTTTLMSFWLRASLDQHTRELIRLKINNTATTEKPESPTVTLTWHVLCVDSAQALWAFFYFRFESLTV